MNNLILSVDYRNFDEAPNAFVFPLAQTPSLQKIARTARELRENTPNFRAVEIEWFSGDWVILDDCEAGVIDYDPVSKGEGVLYENSPDSLSVDSTIVRCDGLSIQFFGNTDAGEFCTQAIALRKDHILWHDDHGNPFTHNVEVEDKVAQSAPVNWEGEIAAIWARLYLDAPDDALQMALMLTSDKAREQALTEYREAEERDGDQ